MMGRTLPHAKAPGSPELTSPPSMSLSARGAPHTAPKAPGRRQSRSSYLLLYCPKALSASSARHAKGRGQGPQCQEALTAFSGNYRDFLPRDALLSVRGPGSRQRSTRGSEDQGPRSRGCSPAECGLATASLLSCPVRRRDLPSLNRKSCSGRFPLRGAGLRNPEQTLEVALSSDLSLALAVRTGAAAALPTPALGL